MDDDALFASLTLLSLGGRIARNTAIGSVLILAGGGRVVLASPWLILTLPTAVLMVRERVRQHELLQAPITLEKATSGQLVNALGDCLGDGIEVATVPLLPGYDLIARGVNQIRG